MSKSPDAFRTISEVAEALDTPAHVLRFWESRFSQVKPVKRAGGRRYYRPSDMALLAGIRKLLHEDGMTIKGVQKVLREKGVKHVAGMADAEASGDVPDDDAPMSQDAPTLEPESASVLPFRTTNDISEDSDDLADPSFDSSETARAPVPDLPVDPEAATPDIMIEPPAEDFAIPPPEFQFNATDVKETPTEPVAVDHAPIEAAAERAPEISAPRVPRVVDVSPDPDLTGHPGPETPPGGLLTRTLKAPHPTPQTRAALTPLVAELSRLRDRLQTGL